jgi:tetratricopeptide (TPR) repeat protein
LTTYVQFAAVFNRGLARLRIGDDENAITDFETALEVDPNDEAAIEVIALVFRRSARLLVNRLHASRVNYVPFRREQYNKCERAYARLSTLRETKKKASLPRASKRKQLRKTIHGNETEIA